MNIFFAKHLTVIKRYFFKLGRFNIAASRLLDFSYSCCN